MMNASLYTPDYSHLTGLLKLLNDDELKELLNSEEKLKTLVHDLKQVHDIEAEREMLLTSNKSISEYNLSRQQILEDHRRQVEQTHKIALELKDNLLEKKKKIESCQQATSQDTLLALLQAATSEKEEEAEAAVEQFLQNELDVEDFLPKFLEIRKTAHLRRIKAEKMAHILQVDGANSLGPPSRPQRLRKPPPPPTTSPLPYPDFQNNIPSPVRQAPQPPPVPNYGNVPAYPYPTGGYYRNTFPTQPPPGAFSYTPPFPNYPPNVRYGHYK